MIKKELLALRTLKATPKMMEMAQNDKKVKREYKSWGSVYTEELYEYSIFMRCQTLKGYLKIAFFLPDHMRCGSDMPVYELYIHKAAGQFLTWDCRKQKWREAMVDNLDWPYGYYRSQIWINPEGAQTIKKYLGVSKTGWDGILEYQRKVREDDLERRYKRQTDPWDKELKQTPALPKDWATWVRKVAVPEHYIFYDYVKSGAREGYCTYCEKTVPIEKPTHNKKGKCRCCGHEITFKSKGKVKYVHTEKHCAYLMQRTKSGFVVREFRTQCTYRQDKGWKANIYGHELRRAFFDKNAKIVSAYLWDMFRNREMRFCSTGNCVIGWGNAHRGLTYSRTIPSLAKAELKMTGLPEYLKIHPKLDTEWYLAVWNRYPQLEQLVKAGLEKLVEDCMGNSGYFDSVYNPSRAGGMAKKMLLDDQRLKRLRENNGGVIFWHWLRHEKKTWKIFPEEMLRFFSDNTVTPDTLAFIRDRMSDVQIYNYIRKQCELSGMKCGEIITTWKDTLSMAQKNGQNLADPYVYKPAKLKQRHDELVLKSMMEDLKKAADKTRKDFPKVESILREIRDIYSYEGEKYSVIVPETILDIMVEGKALSHCIASSTRYLERIERRESYLMFLRKTEAPKQAYYTLEVEPDGTVRQKRTVGDRQNSDIEDAKKFLKLWQKEIGKRLTEKEIDLAKKSKELRIEGFAQMKRDQVRIRTGDLRGHLLVDVLMADLMENEEGQTA